jgi:pentatricopeptide repeat protein
MYGKAGMFDHAQKLFDEMPELKCERTVMSFNALLAACVSSRKYDKISGIIAELPKLLKIDLDMFSYYIVINAFSAMGDIRSALLVIEKMEKNGIEPDLITYNTLLEGLYKAKMFKEADKVWTLMEVKNVSPTVRTYNAKIRGLILDDRLSQTADLIKEMVKASIKPDVYTYNDLIRGSVKADNVFEAKKWYNELANNMIKPVTVTFKIILPFALEKLDFKLGLDLCKDAMKHNATLDVIMVQKIVEGLVKESMIDEAEELVNLGKAYPHYTYRLKIPATT